MGAVPTARQTWLAATGLALNILATRAFTPPQIVIDAGNRRRDIHCIGDRIKSVELDE